MRALLIASALVVTCAGAALAQPRPDILRDVQRDSTRAPERSGEYVDTCINSEAYEGSYLHYFRASGPRTYIHVTSEGLLLSSEGRVSGETSPAVEARYASQIEALRAAATSNSRVRLRHNERYFITQIAITYRNRCS